MTDRKPEKLVDLDPGQPIWDRFFMVAPLVVVGTRSADGGRDFAPKHLALPLGWDNYFGFVCTPRHQTYANALREGAFTVSFLRPEHVLLASLSAAPRCEGDSKPSLSVLSTFPAGQVPGDFLTEGYLFLECRLDRIVDGFGVNSLIAGKVVAAHIQESALRMSDRDDGDVLRQAPLLAYLTPGRYASIQQGFSFPFHDGFKR